MKTLRHTGYMALRDLRAMWRQPWYVAMTLVQPLIWLLLFGELFKAVTDLPGFGDESYIAYLAPGVVIMSALFSSGWNGMATIEDIDGGVTDRLLVSPVSRFALIAGRVLQSAVVVVIQSVVMVAVALAVGASFPGGVVGVLVLIVASALLGAVTFVVLPLTFLSTALMRGDLLPGWMQTATDVNPVDWAIEAGRQATGAGADWGVVAADLGFLTALLVVCGWLAVRAFGSYQRSI